MAKTSEDYRLESMHQWALHEHGVLPLDLIAQTVCSPKGEISRYELLVEVYPRADNGKMIWAVLLVEHLMTGMTNTLGCCFMGLYGKLEREPADPEAFVDDSEPYEVDIQLWKADCKENCPEYVPDHKLAPAALLTA